MLQLRFLAVSLGRGFGSRDAAARVRCCDNTARVGVGRGVCCDTIRFRGRNGRVSDRDTAGWLRQDHDHFVGRPTSMCPGTMR